MHALTVTGCYHKTVGLLDVIMSPECVLHCILESSGLMGVNDQTSVSTGPDGAFISHHRLVTVDHGKICSLQHCSQAPYKNGW